MKSSESMVDGLNMYQYIHLTSLNPAVELLNVSADYGCSSYVSSAIKRIEEFVKKYGGDGRDELNSLASNHAVTLEATDSEKIGSYNGCDFANGNLRILFRKDMLGYNIGQTMEELPEAVNEAGVAAGGQGLDFAATQDVKANFDPNIPAVEAKAKEILAMPSLRLVPNLEANFMKLIAHAEAGGAGDLPREWQKTFGSVVLHHFEAFVEVIEQGGFSKDEMLQEGFQESIDKGIVEFRIVDKLVKNRYHEMILEEGRLVIQTVPEYWDTNIGYDPKDATQELLGML